MLEAKNNKDDVEDSLSNDDNSQSPIKQEIREMN